VIEVRSASGRQDARASALSIAPGRIGFVSPKPPTSCEIVPLILLKKLEFVFTISQNGNRIAPGRKASRRASALAPTPRIGWRRRL